jgi:hypothetical protein
MRRRTDPRRLTQTGQGPRAKRIHKCEIRGHRLANHGHPRMVPSPEEMHLRLIYARIAEL